MAAPLLSKKTVAGEIGDKKDQHETRELIGSLRLPVYDPRVVWARKNDATEKTILEYRESVNQGVNRFHAFLRSIFNQRVLICTMPENWSAST
jgi:hypothetical protein